MSHRSSQEGFREVHRQYGHQAHFYANAALYGAGESLEAMQELAALGHYRWAVDIDSGAGYTAFVLLSHVRHFIVTDLTPQMLREARQVAPPFSLLPGKPTNSPPQRSVSMPQASLLIQA